MLGKFFNYIITEPIYTNTLLTVMDWSLKEINRIVQATNIFKYIKINKIQN